MRRALEPRDDALEIRVTGTESPREPVPSPLDDSFPVRDHLELSEPASGHPGVDVETLLDEGHEPRGLGLVPQSRRAVEDFDVHNPATSRACANARRSARPVRPEANVAAYAPSRSRMGVRNARYRLPIEPSPTICSRSPGAKTRPSEASTSIILFSCVHHDAFPMPAHEASPVTSTSAATK